MIEEHQKYCKDIDCICKELDNFVKIMQLTDSKCHDNVLLSDQLYNFVHSKFKTKLSNEINIYEEIQKERDELLSAKRFDVVKTFILEIILVIVKEV